MTSRARNPRLGRFRVCHSPASLGSSRSRPTTRPSPRRAAHCAVSTPSPQPMSRIDRAAASVNSSSRLRSKPAISRRTTGFVEPYLSKVLPVGTVAVIAGGGYRRKGGAALIPRACAGPRCPGRSPGRRSPRLARLARLVVGGLDAQLELDPPDPLEGPLRQRALGGEQVADHAERAHQHRCVEQHRAERSATGCGRRGRGGSTNDDQEVDEHHERGRTRAASPRPRTP